jgi:mono/diheme cytochrome c family protein
MIDRWPLRHGTALGIGVLVLLTLAVSAAIQSAASRSLPVGYAAPGEHAFADHCGGCHGWYAGGTESSPSLLESSFDADVIESSVREGRGTMPAVGGIEDQELADIIAFVRELHPVPGG